MAALMKAAFLAGPEKMEIKEIPIPEPGPGWVRMKVKACGICGSDMHYYKGNFPELDPDKIKERNMRQGRYLTVVGTLIRYQLNKDNRTTIKTYSTHR